MGLEQNSYKIHENSYKDTEIEKELLMYRNWFEKNTTDLWRHKRMLSILDPFLINDKNSYWLTVGDGRFGTSASYINKNNSKALATDIDIKLLEIAKKEKMLPDFAFANAEKLPFEENIFDYAYCKQSYHHFPRPALAVYEMLRVSKKAIMFTEPNDFIPTPFTRRLLQKIKHSIKKITSGKIEHSDTGHYEPIGNYVYGINLRNFEKIALGIGLPCLAYKRFHDVFIPGMENESLSDTAPLFKKLKQGLLIDKLKTWVHLSNTNDNFQTKPYREYFSATKK
ncbi:MAG: class I SAM-dependent methyltransferase [Bacteroidia bacterium]